MRSAAKHVVSFLTVMIPIFHCQVESCVLPLPGKCSTSNYTIEDGKVCPSAKGDCNFGTAGEGLCDYRQGCKESEMTNWTAENGSVTAKQLTGGRCTTTEYYYSVLESPLLEFTEASCLKFTYTQYSPAKLDVFLALSNGSVITVLNRNDGQMINRLFTQTLQPCAGKIKFRAYGGGGGSRGVVVNSVSVTPGDCKSQERAYNRSPAGDCRPLSTTTTLRMASTNNYQQKSPGSTSSLITSLTTSTNENQLSSARSTAPVILSTPSPSSPSVLGTTGTTSGVTDDNNNDKHGSSPDIAEIAGAAAAAIVTAVVVLAVVFFCRRRCLKRKLDTDKDNFGDMSEIQKDTAESNASGDTSVGKSHSTSSSPPAAVVYVNVDGRTSHDHDEDIDPDHLEAEDGAPGKNRNSSRTDYNYTNTRGALKQNVDPPPAARVVEDDYNHIVNAKDTPQSRGVAEDDKRHIDNPQKTTQFKVFADDDYSHIENAKNTPQFTGGVLCNKVQKEVQNVVQPNPSDVYSVVNKKGKTATPTQPNPNDVYSVVNKKDKKLKVANKPNTPDNGLLPDEYNTLSFNEARKGFAKTERMGSTRTAYDHVQTDPADLYSKAQTGKRHIVIDSDYDHVKN